MAQKPYSTTRIWRETLQKLRLVAAMIGGLSIVKTIDLLVTERLAQLQAKPEGPKHE